MEHEPHQTKLVSDILKGYPLEPKKGKKNTERGELLCYFAEKLDIPIPRVARILSHLKGLPDFYYLKSDCDQAVTRGIPFGAAFWTAIKAPVDNKEIEEDMW